MTPLSCALPDRSVDAARVRAPRKPRENHTQPRGDGSLEVIYLLFVEEQVSPAMQKRIPHPVVIQKHLRSLLLALVAYLQPLTDFTMQSIQPPHHSQAFNLATESQNLGNTAPC